MNSLCALFAAVLLVVGTATAQQVSLAEPMSVRRIGHQSQALGNGRVLVFGGHTNNEMFQPVLHTSCEIFDGATGKWKAAASMNVARKDFASVVLKDGSILAIGGAGANDNPLTSVERYDPDVNTWTPVGNLLQAREDVSAILLDNGSILVMGDDRNSFESGSADGSSWTLHDFPSLAYRFPSGPRMIRLNDSRILVVGNVPGSGANRATIVTQDLVADTTAFPVLEDHHQAGLALLQDGKVLVTGGDKSGVNEIFDPATERFTATGSFALPHYSCPLMVLGDGRIAVLNTGTSIGDTKLLEVYNPSSGRWDIVTHSFTGTNSHCVSSLGNGRFLISGGQALSGATTVGTSQCFILNAGGTVGVEEEFQEAHAYYDPASHSIHVRTTGSRTSSALLLNTMGQVVQRYMLHSEYSILTVPATARGMYFLHIATEGRPLRMIHRIYLH